MDGVKSDSVTLSPPGDADDELGATAGGGAKEGRAVPAGDSGLRVRVNG
jgi:hypothetical protein